ncbi:MAG: hypothetical protein JRN53_06470 [Nitrososphaerota archaeon]|jgi:hypothetical protein|nr:hypothetical protein [Nitrososphaerota archaeon]
MVFHRLGSKGAISLGLEIIILIIIAIALLVILLFLIRSGIISPVTHLTSTVNTSNINNSIP